MINTEKNKGQEGLLLDWPCLMLWVKRQFFTVWCVPGSTHFLPLKQLHCIKPKLPRIRKFSPPYLRRSWTELLSPTGAVGTMGDERERALQVSNAKLAEQAER